MEEKKTGMKKVDPAAICAGSQRFPRRRATAAEHGGAIGPWVGGTARFRQGSSMGAPVRALTGQREISGFHAPITNTQCPIAGPIRYPSAVYGPTFTRIQSEQTFKAG